VPTERKPLLTVLITLLAMLAWVWAGIEAAEHHHAEDEHGCSICAVAAEAATPLSALCPQINAVVPEHIETPWRECASDRRPEQIRARGPPNNS
jgi:hypothetical protein